MRSALLVFATAACFCNRGDTRAPTTNYSAPGIA
jgi:hypothetical protein